MLSKYEEQNFEEQYFEEQNVAEQDGEEQEYDAAIDALLAFLSFLPKDTVKMIDFDRYKLMMQTAAELKDLLVEAGLKGEFDIEVCDLFDSGFIKAELDELIVPDPTRFALMIAKADNFEIYPKTNGKMQLSLTFLSVLKTIE